MVARSGGASAACADQNGSGLPGVIELIIPLRHERSGKVVLATVVPDREVDESGRYEATVTFDDRAFAPMPLTLEADVGRPGPPTRPHRRG